MCLCLIIEHILFEYLPVDCTGLEYLGSSFLLCSTSVSTKYAMLCEEANAMNLIPIFFRTIVVHESQLYFNDFQLKYNSSNINIATEFYVLSSADISNLLRW